MEGRERRSVRLRGYNYAWAGAYFVTVCAHGRACLFGEVVDGEVVPSEAGRIVAACWEAIPDHFPGVELDAFMVMPNHVHGVLVLDDRGWGEGTGGVGATRASPGAEASPGSNAAAARFGERATHASPLPSRARGPGRRSVGAVVGSFKAAVTKRVNEAQGSPGSVLWQRSFYDHVIRNGRALERIRGYIAENPERWAADEENPSRDPVGATHASPVVGPALAVVGAAPAGFGPAPLAGMAMPLVPHVEATPRAMPLVPHVEATPRAVPTREGGSGRSIDGATHASPLPGGVSVLGDARLADRPLLALFCSVRCPGVLILRTYDLARALRESGVATIGGFHTPMERECLTLLLRGKQPVVVCPARGVAGMRLPAEWRKPVADGRLLVLSPFGDEERRMTAALAAARNWFVAERAAGVFVVHAEPGGKTERFCRELAARGTRLLTLDDPDNMNLVQLGAVAVSPQDCLGRLV